MPRSPNHQWAQLFALPEHAALSLQARLRLAVVQAILDAPNERIRSFADAFRVRKDGEP